MLLHSANRITKIGKILRIKAWHSLSNYAAYQFIKINSGYAVMIIFLLLSSTTMSNHLFSLNGTSKFFGDSNPESVFLHQNNSDEH